MMSIAQAESFMVKVLKFQNWNEVLKGDKLDFLRVLIRYFAHHTYFQNITDMACLPPAQRHVPDDKEILEIGMKGVGGTCVVQNSFLALLLQALGFNAYVIGGAFRGENLTDDNHVVCIVEFSPEVKYLLDAGSDLPFAEPVPIHNLPYENIAGGLRYRFKMVEENSYVRVQLDGGLFGAVYEKDFEYPRYYFTTKPVPINHFIKPLTNIYTNIDESIMLQHPFLFRYFEEDKDGNLLDQVNLNGNRKWIVIRGVSVLIGDDLTRKVTHYSSYDEVKKVIIKYFSKMPVNEVEDAIGHFNDTVEKFGFYRSK